MSTISPVFTYKTGASYWAGLRWTLNPNYRPARRGPNPEVRDGWTLRDCWGNAETHVATIMDAERVVKNQVWQEKDILSRDDIRAWYVRSPGTRTTLCLIVERPTSFRHFGFPAIELMQVDASDIGNVEFALGYLGLAHLPQLTEELAQEWIANS